MLEFLTDLAAVSLGCSAAIAAAALLTPLLSRRFAPVWRQSLWLILAMVLMIGPGLRGQLRDRGLQAPVRLETPQVLAESEYLQREGYDQAWAEKQRRGLTTGGGSCDQYGYSVHGQNQAGETWEVTDNWYVRSVTENGVETRSIHWTTFLFLGWLLVAATVFLAGLGRYWRFRRRALRWSTPAGEADMAALEVQKSRLSCADEVELYRCPLIRSPLLMGFSRFVILLPEDLPPSALEAALAHELTHLKRRDTVYLLYLTLARAVHWFNPLVWWMVRQAKRDVELCCDYDLLKGQGEDQRRAYGRAILDQMTAGDRGVSSLTTGFSGDKQSVFARFRAIMDVSPKKKGSAALVLAACVILLAGGVVAFGVKERIAQQPTGGGTVTVDLEGDSVTATYYADGFDGNYLPLAALTTDLAGGEMFLHVPDGVIGPVSCYVEYYCVDDTVALRDVQQFELNPDSQGQLTLAFQRMEGDQKAMLAYFLTWGEDAQFCYGFYLESGFSSQGSSPNGQQLALVLRCDEQSGQITYIPVDWFDHDDWKASIQFWNDFDEQALTAQAVEGTLSSSLQKYVWRQDSVSTLTNTTLDAVISGLPSGRLCELTFDGEGRIKKVILRHEGALDLDGADLDFTGFSGTVYDSGEAAYLPDEGVLIINPCSAPGSYDNSGTLYSLPVAEDFRLTDRQLTLLDGDNTASSCWKIQIEDGVVQSVEEQLEFADAIGYYNSTSNDLDFTASLGAYEGAPCYQFDDPRWGVQLMVQPVTEMEDTNDLAGLLLYQGRNTTFYFHTFPLAAAAYGHAAGESEFLLADLTGDGTPEFIYIAGYHGSGTGSDTCRVFDLATMEEYSVLADSPLQMDFSALEAAIRVDSEQWQDGEIVYQLTGPDGQAVTASCEWPEDRLEDIQPGIAIGSSYYIELNEEKDCLVLTCSVSSSTSPMFLFLGDITAPLSFSPSSKSFSISQPYALKIYQF